MRCPTLFLSFAFNFDVMCKIQEVEVINLFEVYFRVTPGWRPTGANLVLAEASTQEPHPRGPFKTSMLSAYKGGPCRTVTDLAGQARSPSAQNP